jgi:hypothetical protein
MGDSDHPGTMTMKASAGCVLLLLLLLSIFVSSLFISSTSRRSATANMISDMNGGFTL